MHATDPMSESAFHIADDSTISGFYLDRVQVGQRFAVLKINPQTGKRLSFLGSATAGENGWVDLEVPIIVKAGDSFIAVPHTEVENVTYGEMATIVCAVVGVLAIVGYLSGRLGGIEQPFVVAAWCAALGAFIGILGYGPIALLIGAIGRVGHDLKRLLGGYHRRS
jgi:hypothetical protein